MDSFDWQKLVRNRQALYRTNSPSYQNSLSNNQVDLIHGTATFIDSHTIEVNDEQLTADHILIATGTQPSLPKIEGQNMVSIRMVSLNLSDLPKTVAVVGSGYIAVELAGVLNALGSQVGLFIRKDLPVRRFEQFISETLVEAMQTDGN